MAVKVWLRRLGKVWARISSIAPYVAAVVAVLVSLATVFALYRTADLQYRAAKEAVNQQREALNQQYVALAIGLLTKKPEQDIDKALRNWEVDVFKKFAPIPISEDVEHSLRDGAAIALGDIVRGVGSAGPVRP
jgi:hypothetical protein